MFLFKDDNMLNLKSNQIYNLPLNNILNNEKSTTTFISRLNNSLSILFYNKREPLAENKLM